MYRIYLQSHLPWIKRFAIAQIVQLVDSRPRSVAYLWVCSILYKIADIDVTCTQLVSWELLLLLFLYTWWAPDRSYSKAWHDNIILITPVNNQVPVVQTSDSAIYRINLYPDRRLQSLFSLGLYASVSRRNERDECLSRLTPSATPVIIFMSRGFRSKGQEKGDTARSLSDKYQRN